MIEIALLVLGIAIYALGWFHRIVWDKIKLLENKVVLKVNKVDPEPESTFLDPDDIVQVTRFEQQEIERKLNPEKYSQVSEE